MVYAVVHILVLFAEAFRSVNFHAGNSDTTLSICGKTAASFAATIVSRIVRYYRRRCRCFLEASSTTGMAARRTEASTAIITAAGDVLQCYFHFISLLPRK